MRLDANTRVGVVTGYYFFDDFSNDDPYPVQQGGASVPGFNALTHGRSQLVSVGNTKVWSQNLVNEIHASFLRNSMQIGHPSGGLGVKVADQGFVTGPGTPGIVVQNPAFEGVENVVFNSFAMGVTTTGTDQVNRAWQFSDTASRVFGAHTLRIGGQFHDDQVNLVPERRIQRQLHLQWNGDRIRLRRFPARHPEQLYPVVWLDVSAAEPLCGVLRSGQLAGPIQPDP